MAFAYFVLHTPLLSVGAGLGDRATHLWHRTRFQSCGLGSGGSWRLPCFFLFVFGTRFSLLHASFSPSPPLWVAWQWLSLTIHSCSQHWVLLSFCLRTLPASLPFRSEVWEWVGAASLTHVLVRGTGVSMNLP